MLAAKSLSQSSILAEISARCADIEEMQTLTDVAVPDRRGARSYLEKQPINASRIGEQRPCSADFGKGTSF